MITKSMAKSTWAEDMGQFLYYLDPNKKNNKETWKKNQIKNNKKCSLPLTKLAWIITCCLNIHSSKY